eukprot:TRINITY_DN1138_c0_g1_i1.p1 TRINITY_DN1138_c0_g1~~TRINITY_DN1138_c0_g1_i1.p1  ORF type:complete len:423 (+),score=85.83 TRINITY_DN1138_c0_g1_i1:84-1352(+)
MLPPVSGASAVAQGSALLRRTSTGTALTPCLDCGDGALVISKHTWDNLNAELRFSPSQPRGSPPRSPARPGGALQPRPPPAGAERGAPRPAARSCGRSPLQCVFHSVSLLFDAARKNAAAAGGVRGSFDWRGLFALERAVRVKDRINRLELPHAPGPREEILAKYEKPSAPPRVTAEAGAEGGTWDAEMEQYFVSRDQYYASTEREIVQEKVAAGRDKTRVDQMSRRFARLERAEQEKLDREDELRRERLAQARAAAAERQRRRQLKMSALAELEKQTDEVFHRVAREVGQWRKEKESADVKGELMVDLAHLDARTGLPIGSEAWEAHRRLSAGFHEIEDQIRSEKEQQRAAADEDAQRDRSVEDKYSAWMCKYERLTAPRRKVIHGGMLVSGHGAGSVLVEYTLPEPAAAEPPPPRDKAQH